MTQPRTALAAYAHEAWAGWMRYLFSKSKRNADGSITIPKDLVLRWGRQTRTNYPDLPPEEQQSDLAEADKILAILEKTTDERTLTPIAGDLPR